jgi:hypothetical protein
MLQESVIQFIRAMDSVNMCSKNKQATGIRLSKMISACITNISLFLWQRHKKLDVSPG